MSYTRDSASQVTQFTAAIVSVNTLDQTAEAWLRDGSTVTVHTDHAVGAVHVTPAVGEQWVIESSIGGWKMVQRLPFNDPTASIERREGQAIIGSGTGTIELAGTDIVAHSPITLQGKATGGRPSAVEAGIGAMIYDKTLKKPVWSDGAVWRDAVGAAV